MFSSELKMEKTEANHYDELIRSLPEDERDDILDELNSHAIVSRAELLCSELASNKDLRLNSEESRTLFLAALRNLKLGKITTAQLATMHILDSAIHTLYTDPVVYIMHKFVVDNKIQRNVNLLSRQTLKGMPTKVGSSRYNSLPIPRIDTAVSSLPHRMQKPLMQRFFNFTDSEWEHFCKEMSKALPSEQKYSVLIAPEEGCYSSIIADIQKALCCMHTLDWYANSEDGLVTENIMVVPSFSMFQAALNAKAHTLNRTPVELMPTYGYIEAKHYADLKAAGKIAFAMYMPEVNPEQRYQTNSGRFRTTIDNHVLETAFAGAIHDVYHAMREMAMSENVAKARFHLASIAKNHPHNKLNSNSRPVDDILIDGELIFSYAASLDTMFNLELRPPNAETFGDLFYTGILRNLLHDNLKRAFIEDMVVNEALWQKEFNIGRNDLREPEQKIFDEIKSQKSQPSNVISFTAARASETSKEAKAESTDDQQSKKMEVDLNQESLKTAAKNLVNLSDKNMLTFPAKRKNDSDDDTDDLHLARRKKIGSN